MRTPSYQNDRREGLDVKMTPMIDVVFLLLIFFVATASFQMIEHVLPSSLQALPGSGVQTAEDPPPPDFDQVVIQILHEENRTMWLINETAAGSLEQVKQTLQALAATTTEVPLIIDPDEAVPLGDVIDIYDIARLAQFEKIQFAASEDI